MQAHGPWLGYPLYSMSRLPFQLANFNIARMRFDDVSDTAMQGFTSRLDEINAIADASPGFVWRLQTEAGDATALRPYDDERVLINLSIWESIEALEGFVYRSSHGELVKGGRRWFTAPEGSSLVLWWVPRGTIPSVEQAVAKLDRANRDGPSPDAFTFRERFPAPQRAQGL